MGISYQIQKGEVFSNIAMIFVTVVNLVFFTAFHKYIAWHITELDGSITRLSMLTDDYFIWLPIPIVASILAIIAYTVKIFYSNYWYQKTVEIVFITIGIGVTTSLVSIFPFDFSVIPNATAINVVPTAVRVFLILWAVMYGVVILVLSLKLRSDVTKQKSG